MATTLDPVLKKVVDDYIESVGEIPGIEFKSKYGMNGIVITIRLSLLGLDPNEHFVDLTVNRTNDELPQELPLAGAIGDLILNGIVRVLQVKLRIAELQAAASTQAKPRLIVPK